MSKLAILVMGYNRLRPLQQVLNSLKRLIIEDEVPLIITIDGGGTPEINDYIQKYEWQNGDKFLHIHSDRLGLRKHFFFAGDQTKQFENVLFIEDDIMPAPYAVTAAKQLCDHYCNDDRIAAGSLYSPMLCEYRDIKFPRVEDSGDCFMLAHPYWGTIWMRKGWANFRKWFEDYECKPELLPPNVAKWRDGSSFKKVFIQYLIETNRTCVYPKIAYATNMGEKGENNKSGLYCFQTNLSLAEPDLRFADYEQQVARYDAFMEIEAEVLKQHVPQLQGFDFTVDLKQVHDSFSTPYVLTTRPVQKSVITFYGKMKPIENGVLMNIEGTGISLARREDVILSKNKAFEQAAEDVLMNYRLHPKTVTKLFSKTWCNELRTRLAKHQ